MENVSLHLASYSNDCFWDISFLETTLLTRWHSLWNQMTAPHQLIHYQDTPFQKLHYNDVKMGAVASQVTSLTAVHWTVYSDADQRKHQSSMSLAFVLGIYRDWWISRTKGQLREKMSPFDDVIMIRKIAKCNKSSTPTLTAAVYPICSILLGPMWYRPIYQLTNYANDLASNASIVDRLLKMGVSAHVNKRPFARMCFLMFILSFYILCFRYHFTRINHIYISYTIILYSMPSNDTVHVQDCKYVCIVLILINWWSRAETKTGFLLFRCYIIGFISK